MRRTINWGARLQNEMKQVICKEKFKLTNKMRESSGRRAIKSKKRFVVGGTQFSNQCREEQRGPNETQKQN